MLTLQYNEKTFETQLVSIDAQLHVLHGYFPYLRPFVDPLVHAQVTKKPSEGWFVFPDWRVFAQTYSEAVHTVLGVLKARYGHRFINRHSGEIGATQLRETARKKTYMLELRCRQKQFDYLAVHAQFGLMHRNISANDVDMIYLPDEFGLGAYEIGILILTNPAHMDGEEDLRIVGPGDLYNYPISKEPYNASPAYGFENEIIDFEADLRTSGYPGLGMATAFLC